MNRATRARRGATMQSTQTGRPSTGKASSSRAPARKPSPEAEAGPSGTRTPTDGQQATSSPRTPENRNRPPNSGPFLHTPIAKNENSSQEYGFDGVEAEKRYLRLADEAQDWTLGPMPVVDFCNSLCPGFNEMSFEGMPPSAGAFADVPEQAEKEQELYVPLITAVNGQGDQCRCPGITFKDTSSRAETSGPGVQKPDLCGYRDGVEVPEKKSKSSAAVAHMGYAEIFIEVKRSVAVDFFTDPPKNVERSTHQFILNHSSLKNKDIAKRALGQNIAYATEILARQHRHCLFSLSMSGSHVRLFYWDRGGMIVTESVDLHQDPELVCRFLWWFGHASDHARGFDMTVERVTDAAEEEMFKKAIAQHVKEQLLLSASVEDVMRPPKRKKRKAAVEGQIPEDQERLERGLREHYEPGKVAVIHVFEEAGEQGNTEVRPARYLVSRPVISPMSVASRATRGYWAMDLNGSVRFLKDTWRYWDKKEEIEPEGTILKDLKQHEIRNVPKVMHHGDVKLSSEHDTEYQETRTHEFVEAPWMCIGTELDGKPREITVKRHAHYRVVLDIAGYSLPHLQSSKELLRSTRDVLDAMTDVYKKAKKIHRDLSVRNIVLFRKPGEDRRTGYLIDWEFCCGIKRVSTGRQWHITGTWQFMSLNVLTTSNYLHVIQDDMESLLYVVLYCAARWLGHNRSDRGLENFFSEFFDEHLVDGGEDKGGSVKMINKTKRTYTARFQFQPAPLHEWLKKAMNLNCLKGQWKEQYPRSWTLAKLAAMWDKILKMEFPEGSDRVERKIRSVAAERPPFNATHTSFAPGLAVAQSREEVAGKGKQRAAGTRSRQEKKRVEDTTAGKGKQRAGEPSSSRRRKHSGEEPVALDDSEVDEKRDGRR
ncbi:uncharacterized protein LAESUDRAFT_146922 [Laetiporus sulphureus 93-53]|uniref:Protein kinase domain-containing protein n=1 Tax=Laetiporus sulphureus 93-53 TaxID=1314785 RepID=A0A165EBB3_9APHY|nr:uncharacterized protein LAESUDRAFT_146922 [Laetiporus sulphureus 93-53]KZT06652.1 hypothetical protein LAESUDRAFT_146922 [Laetiporus sulphureus 93-53]